MKNAAQGMMVLMIAAMALRPAHAADDDRKFIDVKYGDDPAQRLDIFLPQGDGTFPVLLGIHGGGWVSGDKKWYAPMLTGRALPRRCAVVCIEYRFIGTASRQGITPPVMGPFGDAKRAIQFLRLHAAKWNLDPQRIAVCGGSAGACTALWLGTSPDLADPNSPDPLDRQSTRVLAVGGIGAQTSLDPVQMRQWVGPELKYGAHAYGVKSLDELTRRRAEFEKYFPTISPAAMLSADDPPIFLFYGAGLDDPKKDDNYYTHSPRWGIGFAELARERGATCTLSYTGLGPAKSKDDITDALLDILTAPPPSDP